MVVKIVRTRYDHFRKLALETVDYLYYINSLGYFERVDKKKVKNFALTGDYVFEKMERTITHARYKTPILVSRIQGHQYSIKATIIRIIKNYEYNDSIESIIHIDDDYTNCSADNLKVVNKSELRNSKCIRWKMKINDKEEVYPTTRRLCKRLGVSTDTFYSYMNGKYTSNHWLNDITIERIE